MSESVMRAFRTSEVCGHKARRRMSLWVQRLAIAETAPGVLASGSLPHEPASPSGEANVHRSRSSRPWRASIGMASPPRTNSSSRRDSCVWAARNDVLDSPHRGVFVDRSTPDTPAARSGRSHRRRRDRSPGVKLGHRQQSGIPFPSIRRARICVVYPRRPRIAGVVVHRSKDLCTGPRDVASSPPGHETAHRGALISGSSLARWRSQRCSFGLDS